MKHVSVPDLIKYEIQLYFANFRAYFSHSDEIRITGGAHQICAEEIKNTDSRFNEAGVSHWPKESIIIVHITIFRILWLAGGSVFNMTEQKGRTQNGSGSRIDEHRNKDIQQGIKIGNEQGRRKLLDEVTRNMISYGFTNRMIHDITNAEYGNIDDLRRKMDFYETYEDAIGSILDSIPHDLGIICFLLANFESVSGELKHALYEARELEKLKIEWRNEGLQMAVNEYLSGVAERMLRYGYDDAKILEITHLTPGALTSLKEKLAASETN